MQSKYNHSHHCPRALSQSPRCEHASSLRHGETSKRREATANKIAPTVGNKLCARTTLVISSGDDTGFSTGLALDVKSTLTEVSSTFLPSCPPGKLPSKAEYEYVSGSGYTGYRYWGYGGYKARANLGRR